MHVGPGMILMSELCNLCFALCRCRHVEICQFDLRCMRRADPRNLRELLEAWLCMATWREAPCLRMREACASWWGRYEGFDR